MLGIDWDALSNRASHRDYWLTNSFVPEVLSSVLVRIASLFKDILRKHWYAYWSLNCHTDWAALTCIYRRHLGCQIKKVPVLIRNLDQRDYMGAAATVLAP